MNDLHWDDLPGALETALFSESIPKGLRPMLIQAIAELRANRSSALETQRAGDALLAELRRRDLEQVCSAYKVELHDSVG